MAYSTIVKPSVYFNTKLYTGTGNSLNVTSVGFQPDMVWIKDRTGTNNHEIADAVRGANYQIYPNLTNAQTNAGGHLTAFASDGFTLGTDGATNTNNSNYASWNWKANGQGSSNTAGSINTTYTSVNTTAGFSISKFTGNATDNATVGHGLGAVPDMIIGKDLGDTSSWGVWHKDLTNAGYRLTLSSTAAQSDDSSFFGGSSRTLPTSSVFSLGSGGGLNQSGAANIVYCFAEKTGYSKFGSYVGNGNANGTFIYTGFKPAFLIAKRTDAGAAWVMYDSKRDIDNPSNHRLLSNASNAELVEDANTNIDFLSNGFKTRNADADSNASDGTYIYMAFAEEPLVANSGTDGVPATAR